MIDNGTIIKDIVSKNVKEYSNSLNIFTDVIPTLTFLTNLISKEDFISFFGHFNLNYSKGGNSTFVKGKTTLLENINNLEKKEYIFSNIYDTHLFKVMNIVIPKPNINGKFIVSRIYCGGVGTGSHFHHHPEATNYLISGRKLWVIFPPTDSNYKYYLDNMKYGSINEDPHLWLDRNLQNILDNCSDCNIFFQEQGSVVFIPGNFLHFVVNLTEVIGITYSWKIEDKIYLKKDT